MSRAAKVLAKSHLSIWLCFLCLIVAAIQMQPGFAAMACLICLGACLITLRAVSHLEGRLNHEP